MDHAPFVWGAYGAAFVILAWCAIAPVMRGRKLATLLRARTRPGDTE